jgi:hypothetical protein
MIYYSFSAISWCDTNETRIHSKRGDNFPEEYRLPLMFYLTWINKNICYFMVHFKIFALTTYIIQFLDMKYNEMNASS